MKNRFVSASGGWLYIFTFPQQLKKSPGCCEYFNPCLKRRKLPQLPGEVRRWTMGYPAGLTRICALATILSTTWNAQTRASRRPAALSWTNFRRLHPLLERRLAACRSRSRSARRKEVKTYVRCAVAAVAAVAVLAFEVLGFEVSASTGL